jgi:hypothetical protein
MTKDFNNQGLQNSTITNNSATLDNNGKLGKCGYFSGSTYLKGTIDCASWVDYTLACWIKPPAASAGNKQVIAIGKSSGWTNCRATIVYVQNSTDVIAGLSDGTNSIQYGMRITLTANAWNHVAVTYSNKTLKFYLNGVYQKSYTTTFDPKFSDITNFGVAGASDGAEKFTGYLNDVRIYDHALSPKEIEILSRGLVCHYPLNGGGRGGDNIISGTSPNEVQYTYPSSSYLDKFAKTSTIIPSASQYILSFWAKSTHAGDKVRAHWYSPNTTTKAESNQGSIGTSADGQIDFTLSDKWEKYWCVWTQSSTTAVKHFIFPRMFSQASGGATGTGTVSVKCVKLEEGNIPTPWIPNSADTAYTAMGYNSTTEYDVSGNGYNGTKNGTIEYSSDSARYSVSTVFDGNSASIQIPNLYEMLGSNGSASYSISVWTYKSQIGTKSYQTILGGGSGFEIEARNAAGTDPEYVLWSWGKIAAPYEFNKWNHMVFTKQGSEVKLYVNGVLANQGTSSTGIVNSNYFIGAWNTATQQNYEGQMSDFRLYATALSAEQVAELYNTAVSVANNGILMGYELVEV